MNMPLVGNSQPDWRTSYSEGNFWLVCTTERRTNFDVAIFSSEFHAVNYFIFRLTGEKKTIDWSAI